MGTPIPSNRIETSSARGAGPVTRYTLNPEEIAKLTPGQPIPRSHHKPIDLPEGRGKPKQKEGEIKVADGRIKEGPSCGLTKVELLKAIAAGETISSIERAWKMKNQTLPYWVKTWGLKGITPGKARELLDEMGEEAAPAAEPAAEPATESPEASTDDGKDTEIERLREELSKAIEVCNKNLEIAVSNQLEYVKAKDECRKQEREIERLKDEIQDWTENDLKRAEEIQYLKAEIERLKIDVKPVAAIEEKQPQAFVSLALPLIDAGEDIEERLESLQMIGQLKDKLDIRGISTRRLMDETLELFQVIAGIIHARAADMVRPAEVPATVQAFFSDHNAQHMQRMEKLATEQGWKVVEM
ncbi:hypothetical protein KZ483_24180 [Paenibacillus sp. sptzw28]|uniref:hypothetical protein n=1 Tax=Paenibacillus sp. sptzw28 TaxID=715179 RepID=UPI001C6EE27A|nr:hypothetical protein [Paenibacillus sp. sptzw28]QYR20819.1 hypothetical protein KZ483_24180 [Paenibacillus sp. sptzw28]